MGASVVTVQVLLLDELTTFLDGEDQRGVLEAVRSCVGGPDQVQTPEGLVSLVGLAYSVVTAGYMLHFDLNSHPRRRTSCVGL